MLWVNCLKYYFGCGRALKGVVMLQYPKIALILFIAAAAASQKRWAWAGKQRRSQVYGIKNTKLNGVAGNQRLHKSTSSCASGMFAYSNCLPAPRYCLACFPTSFLDLVFRSQQEDGRVHQQQQCKSEGVANPVVWCPTEEESKKSADLLLLLLRFVVSHFIRQAWPILLLLP